MFNKNDLLSGVYGFVVGDALGVPVEFTSRGARDRDPVDDMWGYGSHNQPKGTWSDDTSMVLATMDAMSRNVWSTRSIMQNFYKWLYKAEFTATGKVFDVGGCTARAIDEYARGEVLEYCGGSTINDNGNGSLMRMLPLVYYIDFMYGREITEGAVEFIYEVSSLTHAHIISKVMCVYYVYIGIAILHDRESKSLQDIITEAVKSVDLYYTGYNTVLEDDLLNVVRYKRGMIQSTGYVVHSLGASLWCIWNTGSYKEAVLTAVNLGGDTDTIGAITGSLAGLYYGVDSIPSKWVDAVKNRSLINRISNSFYEKYK